MIRPEAKEQIWRFREVLVGAAALALGTWWLMGPSLLLSVPGSALAVAGCALIWIGVQRARFRSEGQGPGSVEVDEGEISYFGPLTGGAVSLNEMDRIALDPGFYSSHWRLRQAGVPELLIPVNAEGAETLFDAFAALPGFPMEQALSALRKRGKHTIVIWERQSAISAQTTLH